MLVRSAIGILLLLLGLSVSYAQSLVNRAERDEITHMASEEPAMREAFRKAAATLNEFLALAARPKPGTTGHALKVAISDGRNTEYFWVSGFSSQGERFIGTLDNEPRLVKKVKLGERFEFSRGQIVDWTYIDQSARRMFGNYTACALLTKEPPSQVAEFKKRYGLQCE